MNNRRDFLKTTFAGSAALALSPYINASSIKGNGTPKRFIFIRRCNGVNNSRYHLPNLPENLKAKEKNLEPFEVDMDKYELPKLLQGMSEYKEHMSVIQGMTTNMCENGHYTFQSIMGAFNSKKGSLSALKRSSIDFELAKLFPSPLGHVELSFANNLRGIVTGYSVPSPHVKNFAYADAITAYNNLFKCVLNPNLLNSENSLLQHLKDQEISKAYGLHQNLKEGHDKYAMAMDAVRDRNTNLAKMAPKIAKKLPDRNKILELGDPGKPLVQRIEAMTDVLVSSLTSGMTNVVTYTLDNLNTKVTGLPGLETEHIGLHKIGHNQSYGGLSSTQIRELILENHFSQIKTIVKALKAEPEGNGNMFDNTMIMYFPEGGERHHGQGHPPFFVMSGKNCKLDIAGKYIRFPKHGVKGHKTVANWYTTLLNAHGNSIKHYGDPDKGMTARKLDQTGPIQSFLKA